MWKRKLRRVFVVILSGATAICGLLAFLVLQTENYELKCSKIIANDASAISLAKDWKPAKTWSDQKILEIVEKCDFGPKSSEFYFPKNPLTTEEMDFPLAYVLIVNRNSEQILRLLKAIYWPQNLYCITYDNKSSELIKEFVKTIANCFPNLILPQEHIKIYWGHVSVLQAAINCLQVLHKHPNRWHYVQILSGRDFPLKTNREMVKILKTLNETNDAELSTGQWGRYKYHTEYIPDGEPIPNHWKPEKDITNSFGGKMFSDVNHTKPPLPSNQNLTIYKGSFAATMTRNFIDFVLHNQFARAYSHWLSDTMIPDEQFWSTLIHNPQTGAPGTFPGQCLEWFLPQKKPWISRYHIWPGTSCYGDWIHGSCAFGIEDIIGMQNQPQLIAHKIYFESHPAIFFCLNEQLMNRTYLPISSRKKLERLNLEFYKNLPAVKYGRLPEDVKNNATCDFLFVG